MTHALKFWGPFGQEGAALQIGTGPVPLLLETLFKTFIFIGFEQHPNKLKPQMG